MKLWRIEQVSGQGTKARKSRVFWAYAAGARQALAFLPAHDGPAHVEILGACAWARAGLVFDSNIGFIKGKGGQV